MSGSKMEMRRWVRGWWADQMRNPSVPDYPDAFDMEEFFEIWASESARLADRIHKDPRP